MTIQAAHYGETVEALKADPIIIQMAIEIEPLNLPAEELRSWNFIQRALDIYKERGGQIGTHIGGPAEAIAKTLQEL